MQLDFWKALFRRATPAAVQPATRRSSPGQKAEDPADAALTRQARQLLSQLHCPDFAACVVARWNPRMRSTAGSAYPGKALITLNPRLREFGAAEIDRTLRHELAHLLAHYRSGRRRIAPHGREWRKACADLGLADEERCHDLALATRTVARRHRYRCASCGVELARVRPLRRKAACLKCCRAHNRGQYHDQFRFVKIA